MNKVRFRIAAVLVLLALLLVPAALVAAKELGALTISGPGIKGELIVDDPEQMARLEQNGFMEQGKRIVEAPQGLGDGYTITVHLNMEEGSVEWTRMIYYPAPEGEQGYMYLLGPMNEDAPASKGVWYLAFPPAEEAFKELLAAQGVNVETALADTGSAPPAQEQPAAIQPAENETDPAVNQSAPEVKAQPAVQQPISPAPVAAAPSSTPAIDARLVAGLGALLALAAALGLARWLSVQRQQVS
jgi:hypothetical protein